MHDTSVWSRALLATSQYGRWLQGRSTCERERSYGGAGSLRDPGTGLTLLYQLALMGTNALLETSFNSF